MSEFSRPYYYYRLLWTALDLLFPPVCSGCGKAGARWCADCQRTVGRLAEPVCDICGDSLGGSPGLCVHCNTVRPQYQLLRSWSAFDGPLRKAIHRLKYRRDIGLADALAAQLPDFVLGLHWTFDLIVPVPLGRKRLRERGYNQVGLIARPLSMAMRIAYTPNALMRERETRSQVGLSRMERRDNVCGAFRAKKQSVNDRIVLVMDDVATTGSTLSSCAEALYAAGARDVFALTVARAVSQRDLTLA